MKPTRKKLVRGVLLFAALSLGPATAQLQGQLGVLDLTANNGINPATGAPWAEGDSYRLIFLSSTTTDAMSPDIATYNAFVQETAANSTAFPKLGSATWRMLGSTLTVDARDNTGTNPTVETGVPVFLTDGKSLLAANNAELWRVPSAVPVTITENGVEASNTSTRVFTGSFNNGTGVGPGSGGGANGDGTGSGDTALGVLDGKGVQTGQPVNYIEGRELEFWIRQWKEPAANSLPVYAISEELTVEVGVPDAFLLTITPNASNPGNYDFAWDSQGGMLYDLVSSTVLSTAPDTWAIWDGREGLAATPPGNTLTDIPGGGDARRFFAVVEREAPPLLDETFDAAGPGLPAGWAAANATTVWEVGDPSTLPNLQDGDGTNCAGTNVVAGDYADEVATVTLTSPPFAIPAGGGATLTFRQYIDSDAGSGDVGAVRLLDATDTEIVGGSFPVTGIDGVETGWTNESYPLPASAAGQNVKLVFEFAIAADGNVYKGFYIDDVVVTAN